MCCTRRSYVRHRRSYVRSRRSYVRSRRSYVRPPRPAMSLISQFVTHFWTSQERAIMRVCSFLSWKTTQERK
jgi:hypothetical protein